jgi:hypothetical protein
MHSEYAVKIIKHLPPTRGTTEVVKFSELLREAILSSDAGLDEKQTAAVEKPILDFLEAWIAIHEPDQPDGAAVDPQRAIVLMLMEELADRIEIPIG